MIDIHCHILPAFDDGAVSMPEALEMARLAVSSGVREIVTTPHFMGEPESLWQMKTLLERYGLLERMLRREEIHLKLHLGAEILCLPPTPVMAEAKELPTIGETDYLLVEFQFGESDRYMTQMLEALLRNGYKPVVAHPERYEAVRGNPLLTQQWVDDMGCALQINKGSILGGFGSQVQYTAHFLLDQGLAHLVASDAHSAQQRTPHMGAVRQWLEGRFGHEYARALLERNPARVVEGRDVLQLDPGRF